MNVSVIIPVYQAEHFVRSAVESALAHDEVREIILIEDGSPDDSLLVCQQLVDDNDRVKLFRHQSGVNKGAGASRNLGISKATKDFICFLDADDRMTPERFKMDKKRFASGEEVEGVYGATGTLYYDDKGAAAWAKRGLDEDHITTINIEVPPDDLFEYLIGYKNKTSWTGYFTIDALTLRREALLDNKIEFDESLRLHQDTVFIWKCAYYLRLFAGEIEKPVAIRGVHESNRFIHHKNINSSRSEFFKSLWEWSVEADLKTTYREFFKSSFMYFNLATKNRLAVLPQTILYLLTDKHYRKLLINDIYFRVMRIFKR